MKKKNKPLKHNKKRNTAMLYEFLVREVTKGVLNENARAKGNAVKLCKEFFSKNKPLGKELELYKILHETSDFPKDKAEKLVSAAKDAYSNLDKEEIFAEQTKLIKKMHRFLPGDVFNNFVPDYKNLATIAQIFGDSLPVKDRVLLEGSLVERISSVEEKQEDEKLVPIDALTFNTFVKKFNEAYEAELLPEQRELMTKFVMSYGDGAMELKLFLNEELGRLRGVITESTTLREFTKTDPGMQERTDEVVSKIDACKVTPLDEDLIKEILKIQSLAKEVENDAD